MMRFRTLTPGERIRAWQVAKLQRLNCYQQLVTRLTRGESARSVARWAATLRVEGPAGQWSHHEWRKHINALAIQIREAKARILSSLHTKRRMPTEPPAPEVIEKQVDTQLAKLTFRDCIPESTRRVHDHVEASFDVITAERGLKLAFLMQFERLAELREIEGRMKLLLPHGDRTVDALSRILEKLHKVEMGKKWVRGKFGEMPVIDSNEPLSEIAQEMAKFDEVDRNLLRQAVDNVIDSLAEVTSGRYKIARPGADAPGEVSAEEQASKPAAGPDVPKNSLA